MKKFLFIFSIIIWLLVGASFVFWNFIDFKKEIKLFDIESKNIYPDNDKLNSNLIIFRSNTDISKYQINSSCKTNFKFIANKNDLYFFLFTLKDKNCENPNFSLKNKNEIFAKSSFKLNIQKKSQLFLALVDYPTNYIEKINKVIEEKIKNLSKNNINKKSFSYLKKYRFLEELKYKQNLITNILNRRQSKYSVPVKWYKIATKLNVIPNAARPYRNHYTDWIHHWWDIMAPYWTPVSAIDEWVIIRVVSDFSFEDISKIKKNWKISYEQKLRNLDILRWNQIWLKTSKWDVIFYSHLSKIYPWIEEWKFVNVWENLWEIWKSWVPDRNYKNFHLHFPIMKNPYNIKKAWKYSWKDIMAWDWYLKWENPDEIIRDQKKIFVDEAF